MKEDGGPAFPNSGPQWNSSAGMSLRDWFAGMAMSGIYANHSASMTGDVLLDSAKVSEVAYSQADAMLRERAL